MDSGTNLSGSLESMQQKDFKPRLREVIALAVLICLTGCITVTRETEPPPIVTTTETRSSTIAPAAATTVEGTVY
jgi:hypothetical protein